MIEILDTYQKFWEGIGARTAKSYLNILNRKEIQKMVQIPLVKEEPRYIKYKAQYLKLYYLSSPPNFVSLASIYRLINLPFPMYLTFFVKGTNKQSMLNALKLRYSVLESDQNIRVRKGKNYDLEIEKEMNGLNAMIKELLTDEQRVFEVSSDLAITSNSLEKLANQHCKLKDSLYDLDLKYLIATFDQGNVLKRIVPTNSNDNGDKHYLLSEQLTHFLPFVNKDHIEERGIFLGVDHYNLSLIILDIFKYRNANINIFGTSGSGKSVLAKLLIKRSLLRDVQNIIFDPEGEYSDLVDQLNGVVYSLSDKCGIDPIRVICGLECGLNTKVQVLVHFFEFFIQTNNRDRAVLDRALSKYLGSRKRKSIRSFLEYLNNHYVGSSFLSDIDNMINGSFSSLFSNSTDIDETSKLISFDLSELQTQEQKVPIIFLLGSFIKLYIKSDKGQKLIFLDEAHKLLFNKVTTSFYIDMVKTARKRNAGIVSITQNPEDFKEEDGSRTILTQSELTFLLKESPASINYIKRFDLYRLSKEEQNDLATLSIGETILIRDKQHLHLDVIPFKSENKILFS